KWSGNMQVGAGKMTIVESKPNELIRIRLEFEKPMPGTNMAEFSFKADGGQTRVTWSNSGDKNFVCKAMGLFMDMDKMIGDMFDQGLANLKAIVEKNAVATHP
ncbi:MAG TPA: SRPBCC family protein, partial [Pirellulales bacterium]|nr:SRPBCC family protein [Pirellulales bacterium]